MSLPNLVYPSDLADYPYGYANGKGDKDKAEVEKIYVVMPPPPSKFPLYPYAPYPCPPPPFPPHPDERGEDTHPAKQSDVEKQICKLSHQSANLRALIENIEEKNKSLIIKSGSYSYSLGEYKTPDPEDPSATIEDEDIKTILDILREKLEQIKQKIKDLSDSITTDAP